MEKIEAFDKSAELRKLTGEIDALAYWVNDYAGDMDNDDEREKMADASYHIHLLSALIKLCPDDVLNRLQL